MGESDQPSTGQPVRAPLLGRRRSVARQGRSPVLQAGRTGRSPYRTRRTARASARRARRYRASARPRRYRRRTVRPGCVREAADEPDHVSIRPTRRETSPGRSDERMGHKSREFLIEVETKRAFKMVECIGVSRKRRAKRTARWPSVIIVSAAVSARSTRRRAPPPRSIGQSICAAEALASVNQGEQHRGTRRADRPPRSMLSTR